MLSAIFKFVPDEPNAVKIHPHRELLIFNLRFYAACALLCQRLMIQGKSEDYVSADLSGMQFAVEPAKLECMVTVKKLWRFRNWYRLE